MNKLPLINGDTVMVSKIGREPSKMLPQIWATRSIDTGEHNLDDVTEAIRNGWYLLSVSYNGKNPVFCIGSVNPADNPLKNDPTWQGQNSSRTQKYAAGTIDKAAMTMTITDLDRPDLESRHIDLRQSRSH